MARMARTGTIPRKMRAIWTLMRHAITMEKTIMRGTHRDTNEHAEEVP